MNNSDYKILIVDDEPDLLELLTMQFEMDDYVCFSAADGQTALEVVKDKKPHLIISDYNMPNMNGGDLLLEVKALYPNTIFILFLSDGGEFTPEDAIKLGCTAVIEKPFDQDKLSSIISKSLAELSLEHTG